MDIESIKMKLVEELALKALYRDTLGDPDYEAFTDWPTTEQVLDKEKYYFQGRNAEELKALYYREAEELAEDMLPFLLQTLDIAFEEGKIAEYNNFSNPYKPNKRSDWVDRLL